MMFLETSRLLFVCFYHYYLLSLFVIIGMCETLWKPNMNPDELFECIAQSLINAFDRDASSGWGAVVHIIEKDKITTKNVKTRMD